MDFSTNSGDSLWHLPNKYPHKCPFCGKKFEGRKNREYCPDTKCKQARAYQKRCLKIEITKSEVAAFINTVSVFHEISNNRNDSITLPTSKVRSQGVDFIATPFKTLKDEIDGTNWYGVGPYEYQFSDDQLQVTIRKTCKSIII